MTVSEVAAYLRAHDKYLILTHRRPDGDTLGCAAALCAMLRQMGKTAGILYNRETTEHFESYVEQYWVADDFDYETVVSVDLAALSLFPDNAEMFKTRVDLAIDHHPSYEGFGKESCVHPECAACGEILCELAQELGQLTPAVALPLYVAVSTDTGCFVYSNVTANTHRVAAALMETGIDYKAANKLHFRTKSKKRLALEGELLRTMEFYDEDRVVIVAVPQSLQKSMALSEADMEDLASLGGLVEGTDCAVTMKETKDGAWKVSLTKGFIALSTTRYTRWEDFAKRLDVVLAAFIETYQPSYFSRVGLRYMNALNKDAVGLEESSWRELIAPGYLGLMADDDSARQNFIKCEQTVTATMPGGAKANIKCGPGLLRKVDNRTRQVEELKVFLLDLDVFFDGKMPLGQVAGALNIVHDNAGSLFAGAVRRPLLDAMEPMDA